ncbi:MAG: helix-turn-helix domain-containing protein [Pseudonocardiaceae bacterium]|nr:helix-turn-helix domain-containing protein [Pseudonocardiaceae bacterium]
MGVSNEHDDVDRFYREFGQRLHDARTAAKISQENLGARIGLNRTSISNIEKGRQRLLVHQLPVLARVLGMAPDELLPVGPSAGPLDGVPADARDWAMQVLQADPNGDPS